MIFQKGTLNDKTHVLNGDGSNDDTNAGVDIPTDGMSKVSTAILSSPGPIVSFSMLVKKGIFRRSTTNSISNKELMLKAVNKLSQLHFGNIENFTITSNNSKVGKNE